MAVKIFFHNIKVIPVVNFLTAMLEFITANVLQSLVNVYLLSYRSVRKQRI